MAIMVLVVKLSKKNSVRHITVYCLLSFKYFVLVCKGIQSLSQKTALSMTSFAKKSKYKQKTFIQRFQKSVLSRQVAPELQEMKSIKK